MVRLSLHYHRVKPSPYCILHTWWYTCGHGRTLCRLPHLLVAHNTTSKSHTHPTNKYFATSLVYPPLRRSAAPPETTRVIPQCTELGSTIHASTPTAAAVYCGIASHAHVIQLAYGKNNLTCHGIFKTSFSRSQLDRRNKLQRVRRANNDVRLNARRCATSSRHWRRTIPAAGATSNHIQNFVGQKQPNCIQTPESPASVDKIFHWSPVLEYYNEDQRVSCSTRRAANSIISPRSWCIQRWEAYHSNIFICETATLLYACMCVLSSQLFWTSLYSFGVVSRRSNGGHKPGWSQRRSFFFSTYFHLRCACLGFYRDR